MAIAPGSRVPGFEVLDAAEEPVSSADLWAGGPKVVLFFPFAFSGITDG